MEFEGVTELNVYFSSFRLLCTRLDIVSDGSPGPSRKERDYVLGSEPSVKNIIANYGQTFTDGVVVTIDSL